VLAAVPVVLMSAHYGGPSDSDLARRVGANAFLRRTADFEELVPAVMAALRQDRERPPPVLTEPVEQLRREAAGRALNQLDLQLIASMLQAQRTAHHAAQLSILSGVATTLTRSANVEAELGDVLAACLDAGGFDRGALYRAGADGALRLSHVVGFPNNRVELEEVFGQPELLRRAVREAAPLALTTPPLEANDRARFLARAGVGSAMFIPLLGGGQCVGALLLGANDASSDDGQLAFARALGAHIGQAIVLAESFARERAARAAAEEASRTKDEFLAMLGHELRNPLAPIVTALELMRLRGNGVLDDERAVIERQVDHLIHLVDDLLDVSRITRGKVNLKRQRMELCKVVERAIEMAGPLLDLRHQHLSVTVAHKGLAVDADPTRLAQVVANLLTNAAKYTEERGRISLVAARENEVVVLHVQDSGIGIAPEMLAKVFDLFTQERQALDRSRGGLGLGLAIVRSLVALHGGRVSVHSDGIGRGSEFTIWLPAALDPEDAARVASPLKKEEPPRGLAILVVDDNEDAADLLAQYLGELGHKTCIAHDGPAALRAVIEFQPDVALLDIGLPVMDGYELARRLREQSRSRQMRLVAITGYGQDNDRARSSAAGFDAHLVKPVDLNRLHLVIRGSP
jgi:signal transduction histidine kinase/DNA-binding response OmpR family regulator